MLARSTVFTIVSAFLLVPISYANPGKEYAFAATVHGEYTSCWGGGDAVFVLYDEPHNEFVSRDAQIVGDLQGCEGGFQWGEVACTGSWEQGFECGGWLFIGPYGTGHDITFRIDFGSYEFVGTFDDPPAPPENEYALAATAHGTYSSGCGDGNAAFVLYGYDDEFVRNPTITGDLEGCEGGHTWGPTPCYGDREQGFWCIGGISIGPYGTGHDIGFWIDAGRFYFGGTFDDPLAPPETSNECLDGIDDADGRSDWPLDLGCSDPFDASEGPDYECWDGRDNDGDGQTDLEDSHCGFYPMGRESWGPDVPGAPQDVQAIPGDGEVSVTWVPPSTSGAGAILEYEVCRSNPGLDPSDPSWCVWAPAATRNHTFRGLMNGISYRFWVYAENAYGQGPVSADATATPQSRPMSCSDGLNNDADGTTDWPADTGCADPFDDSEGPNPECSDGIDNDNDGKTDWNPNLTLSDPSCSSPYDESEQP